MDTQTTLGSLNLFTLIAVLVVIVGGFPVVPAEALEP